MGGYAFRTMDGEHLAYFTFGAGVVWRQAHFDMDNSRTLSSAFLRCGRDLDGECRRHGCFERVWASTVADRDRLMVAHRKLQEFLDANPYWEHVGKRYISPGRSLEIMIGNIDSEQPSEISSEILEGDQTEFDVARGATELLANALEQVKEPKVRIFDVGSCPDGQPCHRYLPKYVKDHDVLYLTYEPLSYDQAQKMHESGEWRQLMKREYDAMHEAGGCNMIS